MSGELASIARFLLVGAVNTCVGLGCIFLLKAVAGWGDVAANLGGYGVGLRVSFVLNHRWTFRHQIPWRGALLRLLAVFLMAYLPNLFVMLLLRDSIGLDSSVALTLSLVLYTVLFYLGSRCLPFAPGLSPTEAPRRSEA